MTKWIGQVCVVLSVSTQAKWWEKDQNLPPNKRTSTCSHPTLLRFDRRWSYGTIKFMILSPGRGFAYLWFHPFKQNLLTFLQQSFPTCIIWFWLPFVLLAVYTQLNNRGLERILPAANSEDKGAWRHKTSLTTGRLASHIRFDLLLTLILRYIFSSAIH